MPEPKRAADVVTTPGLEDWRYILGAIEATFVAEAGDQPAFSSAAVFAQVVAAEADLADHHPDIGVRYPGIVHVSLTTHALGGLSDLDLALARTISERAAAAGLTSSPTVAQRVEVAIDAMDIEAIRPFWMAVLGFRSATDDAHELDLRDPRRLGPNVWFQQMDAERPQRNRIHLDVSVPHDEAEARVKAALDAGGVLVSDERAKAFWVLADVEGNEVCVCTWQDRD